MKKVFMTLAVALMGFTAVNAQLVLGGDLGLSGAAGTATKNDGDLKYKGNSSFNFTFAPKAGYLFNDGKMEAGAAISLGYNQIMSYVVLKDHKAAKNMKDPNFTIYFTPYYRYYFLQKGNFSFGVEADLSFGSSFGLKNKYYEYDETLDGVSRSKEQADKMNDQAKEDKKFEKAKVLAWQIAIAPVAKYDLTDHFYVDVTLNALALYVGGDKTSYNFKSTELGKGGQEIKFSQSNFNGGLRIANHDYIKLGFAYKF